jgi:hypothetical protein
LVRLTGFKVLNVHENKRGSASVKVRVVGIHHTTVCAENSIEGTREDEYIRRLEPAMTAKALWTCAFSLVHPRGVFLIRTFRILIMGVFQSQFLKPLIWHANHDGII